MGLSLLRSSIKEQIRLERLNEQAVVEATEEYQLEHLLKELEDILDVLATIAQEAGERDALRRAGLNA